MARIRSIKPTLWASEKLGRLSVLARLNFVGLISLADDEGRGRGTTRFLIGQLHPYAEHISEQEFASSLIELEAAHLVAFYSVEGCRYYALPGWRRHQYIEKGRRSELPPVPKDHAMAPLFVGEKEGNDSPPSMPRKGREGIGLDGKTAAPSAADLSGKLFDGLSKKTGRDLLEMQIPFEFGDIPRGRRVIDIDAESAKKILNTMPRLGEELERALKYRIKVKLDEMTPAQRRARA